MSIKITHIGEDYASIEINGEEFETSIALAKAIIKEQKDFPLNSLRHLLDYIVVHPLDPEKNLFNSQLVDESVRRLAVWEYKDRKGR